MNCILKGCQHRSVRLTTATCQHPFRMQIPFRGPHTEGVADAQPPANFCDPFRMWKHFFLRTTLLTRRVGVAASPHRVRLQPVVSHRDIDHERDRQFQRVLHLVADEFDQ